MSSRSNSSSGVTESGVTESGVPESDSGFVAKAGSVHMLNHARLRIALHCLSEGAGQGLLLLHGLGERSPGAVPSWAMGWTGPVYALDFTGHGLSDRPVGGGYNCELLMADVDTVLAATGPVTIVGRGLGGYVGLLIAGARPMVVRGLVIADGVGLAGGGVRPGAQTIDAPNLAASPTSEAPDPFVFLELTSDIRPGDYAVNFLRACVAGSDLARPVSVASAFRPPWLQAVCEEPGVTLLDIREALTAFAPAQVTSAYART
jgi:pimeloyl-ACP methyl ester carboxylesterase